MSKDIRAFASGVCDIRDTLYLSGAHRLAQKFVIELLTLKGSMLYLPNRGSDFLRFIGHQQRTELDILVAFATASRQVGNNLRSDETQNTALDECFKRAWLDKILLSDQNTIQLIIAIQNRAGKVIQVITPKIPL